MWKVVSKKTIRRKDDQIQCLLKSVLFNVEFLMIFTVHNFHDSKHEMQWTFYKYVAQSRGMPGMRPLWSAFSTASTLNLFQNQLCFNQLQWFGAWGQIFCNVLAHIGPHLWYIQLISGIFSIRKSVSAWQRRWEPIKDCIREIREQ